MGGLINNAVERYIPLEQGLRELNETICFFKDSNINVELTIKNWIAEKAPLAEKAAKNIEDFEQCSDNLNDEAESVDIYEPEDLVFYKAGDIIHDTVKLKLKGIRESIDKNKDDITASLNKTYAKGGVEGSGIRMALLCNICNHLLPKNIWDLFEEKVEDDIFFYTLYTLLSIKSDTIPMCHYVKGLLYNPALFEKVIMSDDIGI